ncbi:hypothetical protein [Hoeflea alexandrii]|uniref:SMODS and SLOG-associating 2TM effector domain-containing protein n=1 Tax=Hoeflea alexandrii TaxID=288436 RepID=A0ABT1CV56_9HYPH|nr:hypothetical protein [Hoeflea alexandrii]MCO6410077.1 hypothetical protein [Hoeflea alexandrii]MCY0153049.1 hypothetical protein [Hoeflea alexandrii]
MDYDRENLRFNTVRNALYHTARRRAFEFWARCFSFLVIVLGTTAASDVLQRFGIEMIYPSIAVAVVGAIQLVFDPGGKARTHQMLQRDYYRLLAEIEEKHVCDEHDLASWRGELARIAADEPPVLRAIDAKAYNDALDALETFDRNTDRLVIPWFQRLAGGLFYFEGHAYKKVGEIG